MRIEGYARTQRVEGAASGGHSENSRPDGRIRVFRMLGCDGCKLIDPFILRVLFALTLSAMHSRRARRPPSPRTLASPRFRRFSPSRTTTSPTSGKSSRTMASGPRTPSSAGCSPSPSRRSRPSIRRTISDSRSAANQSFICGSIPSSRSKRRTCCAPHDRSQRCGVRAKIGRLQRQSTCVHASLCGHRHSSRVVY